MPERGGDAARRTGYSAGYLGNVETGTRTPTPALIRKYERALGDDLNRRVLLAGLAAGLTAASPVGAAPDMAVDVFRNIAAERDRRLAKVQTTHETDKMISHLVAKDLETIGSLTKWTKRGSPVLRVNSAGILAKVGSTTLDNDVAKALRSDAEMRSLYLTAVISRVLRLPWDDATSITTADHPTGDPGAVSAFSAEVLNPSDSGARWCSVIMLGRLQADHRAAVETALRAALHQEQAPELLRTLGYVLAGTDPLRT